MTRQPAAEKRFTVAWPMPRLAPVSSRARRGWLEWEVGISHQIRMRCCMLDDFAVRRSSWVKPGLAPGRACRIAGEFDAIVKPERTIVPELYQHRHEAVAGPVR